MVAIQHTGVSPAVAVARTLDRYNVFNTEDAYLPRDTLTLRDQFARELEEALTDPGVHLFEFPYAGTRVEVVVKDARLFAANVSPISPNAPSSPFPKIQGEIDAALTEPVPS